MLTDKEMAIVNDVHKYVRSIFTYVSDQALHETPEFWMSGDSVEQALNAGGLYGDCDDFALACRRLLWKNGIQNRLILCKTETNELHLVCEAGGVILDNRQQSAVKAQELPYTWIKMSGYQQGDDWVLIKT